MPGRRDDVLSGGEVVLSSGPVVDALLASAAIPGVFPPVEIDGQHLIDGGMSSNTPISTAIAQGAERIVVPPTGFACALEKPPAGPMAMVLHALTLLIARQLGVDVCAGRRPGRSSSCRPSVRSGRPRTNFSASASLIERAAASTRSWLAAGGLERPNLPHELTPHSHDAL